MPLYRVLGSLRFLRSEKRIPAGTVSSLRGVSAASIKLLLSKGRIAEVQAPPLSILPGWKEKAEVYAELSIETVGDLVEAKDVPPEDVKEALRWIAPPDEEVGKDELVDEG